MAIASTARCAAGAPWSRRPWLATLHLAVGVPIGLASSSTVGALVVLTVPLLPTVLLAVPGLGLLVVLSAVFAAVQRARFAGLLEVELASRPRLPADTRPWRNGVELLRSGLTWRRLLYHLLAGLLGTLAFLVVMGLWLGGAAGSVVLLYGWSWPGGTSLPVLVLITVAGVAAFHAAPWSATVACSLDVAAARALLQPSRRGSRRELSRRVRELTHSRTEVIAAADAERRRIERDLHDGAQQRLVSLAMNLGMARSAPAAEPEPLRQTVTRAHEEVKGVLVEIRDLVRGLHPAMLDERGLDAALSGLTARSPVPVRLTVDLPHRPPAPTEVVAYFVVSEALTNVAKHASASHVDISVGCRRRTTDTGVLVVRITDDGRGGARLEDGTGLQGLAGRVAAADGTFAVHSPRGGPTVLTVELPCAS